MIPTITALSAVAPEPKLSRRAAAWIFIGLNALLWSVVALVYLAFKS